MERDTLYGIFILALLIMSAIIAYHFLENWAWLDSAYFAVATITTVGYGDFTPKSEYGKLFTIFFIIFGVSTGFYTILSLGKPRETVFRARFERIMDSLATSSNSRKSNNREGRFVQEKLSGMDFGIGTIQSNSRKSKDGDGRFVQEDYPR